MAALFFVMLLLLIDLFANIWGYIDNKVLFTDILMIMLLYVPKCLSYAIPVALLFSISFTLGTLYGNNELIAIFGGGMSLFTLVLPLLIMGALLSAGVFFFEENVVIWATRAKQEMQAQVLKRPVEGTVPRDKAFIDRDRNIIIKVDSFIPQDNMLTGVTIIYGEPEKVIYADNGRWNGKTWQLQNTFLYENDPAKSHWTCRRIGQYQAAEITQTPEKFKISVRKVEDMNLSTATQFIDDLRFSGLPSIAAETDFFNKFSYAMRVFIVTIIAASIGGAFRKNILLMCLLVSLVISVVFFVFQLVTDAFAKNGILPPVAGAFLPVLIFLAIGFFLMKKART